jgi:hypothetical protein
MPNPSRDTTAGRVYNDLRNLARRTARNTDEILLTYVLERFLYRVSIATPQHFILKGGLLLATFDARRPTRDIDVLAQSIPNDPTGTRDHLIQLTAVDVDDGLTFNTDDIRTTTIREDANYLDVRATTPAHLAGPASNSASTSTSATPSPRAIA